MLKGIKYMKNTLYLFNRLDINIYLPIFLFVFLFYISKMTTTKVRYVKYMYIAYSTLSIALIYECIMFIVLNFKDVINHNLFDSLYIIYYMLQLIYTVYISKFIIYFVNPDYEPTKLHKFLSSSLFTVCSGFIFVNIFTKSMYEVINYKITYGVTYPLFILFLSLYTCYILFYIIKNKKLLTHAQILLLIVLQITTLVFLILQVCFYHSVSGFPIQAVIGMFFIITFQDKLMSHDSLTRTYTRSYFESKLDSYARKKSYDYTLAFIDMDDFKKINDEYGYNEGDIALATFAKIVMDTLNCDEKLIRYGGDEFILFIPYREVAKVEHSLQLIKESIEHYNTLSDKEYNLEYSISYEAYDVDKYTSPSMLLHMIDNKMYTNKINKKKLEQKRKMAPSTITTY